MKRYEARPLLLIALLALSNPCHAANMRDVLGRWIEKHEHGKLVLELSETTISYYPEDDKGNQLKSPQPMAITYKDLGGDSIGIEFQGGGGIMIFVKDSAHILMDFPGLGAHFLERARQ
jgi:hypothetical protein